MMVMGSICIAMSLSKGVPFFLKPAAFCFILSGGIRVTSLTDYYKDNHYLVFVINCQKMYQCCLLWFIENIVLNVISFNPALLLSTCAGILVLISILVFHQSVLALLSSDHSIPVHHELSWSVVCAGSAGAILIFGGLLFVILSLPFSPWQKCLPHKNSAT